MNNVGTSISQGTFKQDLGINGAKILTGAFGMGVGNYFSSSYLGGTVLPGAYYGVTDNVIESGKKK